MSKVGQWVFEMQENAREMTLGEFINQYGEGQKDIWYEANGPEYPDDEPYIPEDLPCEKIFF